MAEEYFDDGQLIKIIQQYPLIWNGKHADHRYKLKLENAWTTIAEIMGSTVEICEQRCTTIRYRFAKERRLAQRPSGSTSYTITWPLYTACSFLDDVVVSRKTVGNVKRSALSAPTVVSTLREESRKQWDVGNDLGLTEAGGGQETGGSSQAEMEQEIAVEIEEPDIRSPTFVSEGDEPRSGSSSRLSMLRQNIPKKRKRQEDEGAAIAELSSTITSAFKDIRGLTQTAEDPEATDEDFVFGRTVAVMLTDVKGKKRKALLKAKIVTLIAEATDDDL